MAFDATILFQSLKRPIAALLIGVAVSSCTSLPVGNTPDTVGSNIPAYPTGYGVAVTERTLSQRLLDRSIEHTAAVNIKALDPNLAQNSRLSIDSFYSEVLLTGEVPDEHLKQKITAIVRSMPDVRQVYDEIKVAPNRGYSSTLQDGYITSKFMAKVLASQRVKTSQVKAVTDNGALYIMGRMTPTQQSHLIDIANQTVGITELILLTSLVNDAGELLDEQDVMQEHNLDYPSDSSSALSSNRRLMKPQASSSVATNAGDNSAVAPTSEAVPAASSSSESSPYIDLYRDQVTP